MLTQSPNAANLSPLLPHEATKRYWRIVNLRRIAAAFKAVFLCVKHSQSPSIMPGLNEHTKVWPALRLVRQLVQFRHHNWRYAVGLSILSKDLPAMKTSPATSGKTQPKTTKLQSRFEMFQDGVLIASNLNGYAALGLKRMFPNTLTVKFVEMTKVGV